MLTSLVGRVRAKDPDLGAIRRAARVTLVASVAFYVCRYGFDDRVMAAYALFGPVALGALAQIPGSPGQRSRTLLVALPVGWVLVAVGTLLAVSNIAAAVGMFVVGFLVAYSGVGGPRAVGLATGLQLFYILPCFPPFTPEQLPARLVGLTVGVLGLAAAEVVLWPDRSPEPYRDRLATAVGALAGCLEDKARGDKARGDKARGDKARGDKARGDKARGDKARADKARGDKASADSFARAGAAIEAIQPARVPPGVRPSSASRRDRALSNAAGLVRYTFARTIEVFAHAAACAHPTPEVPGLVQRSAAGARSAQRWLDGTGPVPDADQMPAALAEFRAARARTAPDAGHPDRLRLGSATLAVGDGVLAMVTAIRAAAGATVPDDPPLWYAHRSGPALWWHRLREHLTPRSVYFQGALRLALALAVGRLCAGFLDLSHGFWVLLAILTVLRASVTETRAALWQALVGTLIGAALAGGLLAVAPGPWTFALLLPVVMLVAFACGPLVGPALNQAAFTLVLTLIFAQLAPADWRLAEVRLLDVAVGGAIGVLIGLCAWPRGGAGEMCRATSAFLRECADVIRQTVASLTAPGRNGDDSLAQARRAGQLADASFALYQNEPGMHISTVDWQAALVAAHHVVRGAEWLHRTAPPGALRDCAQPMRKRAVTVSARFDQAATEVERHQPVEAAALVPGPQDWPAALGPDLYHLADLRTWLDGVEADLTRVPLNGAAPAQSPVTGVTTRAPEVL